MNGDLVNEGVENVRRQLVDARVALCQRNHLGNVVYLDLGTLNTHLEEIDRQANEMLERIVYQMAKAEAITEQLKATSQMEWLRRMNSIYSRAEEAVIRELIYT